MTDQNNDNTNIHVVLKQGIVVSHYRIVEKIGAGGMGEVWMAHDEKLNRKVALKFPSTDLYAERELHERLLSEAQAAAALHHPNIVTVHEIGDFDGRSFLAMSYIEGPTLKELMTKQKIPVDMIVNLGAKISNALAAAHELGITHRDLKPGNIILDQSHNPYILDFGLSVTHDVSCDNDVDKTVTLGAIQNITAGTLSYMAPEQITNSKISPHVDIFALGIILFELTYGSHPFKGESPAELYRNILQDALPQFPDRGSDLPYDLIRIIRRCLQKDPENRFQTAKDVRNELLDLHKQMIKGEVFDGTGYPTSEGRSFLSEERFALTADLVRQLEFQSPKMIGDHIVYLDNGVLSDTLVIYLHAWGLDYRQCADYLKALPYRGIAPTLYGFGQHSEHRFPLTLNDHSILLRALFGMLGNLIKPRYVILAGHSSGADQVMHISTSDVYPGLDLTGLLLFGCNTNLGSCFLSEKIGNNTRSLNEWLKFHEYMVTVFSKFGANADPLRVFGADLVKPFRENDWKQFASWYRVVNAKYPNVRFVIDADDFDTMDKILGYHLRDNALGDDFKEDSIVREDVPHVELAKSEILLKHTLEFIAEFKPE
jgi:serine/threonine protein kinase